MSDPQSPQAIAAAEFQEQAQIADKLFTAALARIGQELAPDGQDEAFISATISGAMMALVRYYATTGRDMGQAIRPRTIILAFTPCLHRSAEAYVSEILVDRRPQ